MYVLQQPRSKPKEGEGGRAEGKGSTIEAKIDNKQRSTSEKRGKEGGDAAILCTNIDDKESNKKSSSSGSADDPETKKPRLSSPEKEEEGLVVAS